MMHYAVTHQTAAEIVYDRADAEKPHMGLMTWKNAPDGRVVKSDVTIAKNYLSEKEVDELNLLTTAFLCVIRPIPVHLQNGGAEATFFRPISVQTELLWLCNYTTRKFFFENNLHTYILHVY